MRHLFWQQEWQLQPHDVNGECDVNVVTVLQRYIKLDMSIKLCFIWRGTEQHNVSIHENIHMQFHLFLYKRAGPNNLLHCLTIEI